MHVKQDLISPVYRIARRPYLISRKYGAPVGLKRRYERIRKLPLIRITLGYLHTAAKCKIRPRVAVQQSHKFSETVR